MRGVQAGEHTYSHRMRTLSNVIAEAATRAIHPRAEVVL